MHIPDGFIAPQVYVPATAAAAGFWWLALRRMRRRLRERTIPLLAVMTALAFILMSIALPVPGGTSVHASGVALLAVCLGPWTAFASCSLVLFLQAFLLGAGGITSLPINALTMGLAGGLLAAGVFRLLGRRFQAAGLLLAGWVSVVGPALMLAVVLGLQPRIAHTPQGEPLFFPFGLGITIPAVVLPHLLVGIVEGVLTLMVYRIVQRVGLPVDP